MRKPRRPRARKTATGFTELELLSCWEGETWWVRSLTDEILSMYVHYIKNRSRHCLLDECPPHLHKIDQQWYGYTPVEAWDEKLQLWFPWVWEMTPHAHVDIRKTWARGQVWEISRELPPDGARNKPVKARLLEEGKEAALPPAFDILPLLYTVYNTDHLRLGVPNRLPDRIMVQANHAPPPECKRKVQAPPMTTQEKEAIPKFVDRFKSGEIQLPNFSMPSRKEEFADQAERNRRSEDLAELIRKTQATNGTIKP